MAVMKPHKAQLVAHPSSKKKKNLPPAEPEGNSDMGRDQTAH